MSGSAIIGLQWGDEGKGKIVDYLTSKADAVVRFQGGHNAGHTIYVGGEKVVLHLLPSGALHPQVMCFIGNGVVLSIRHLLEEISILERQDIQIRPRLFLSPSCSLLFSCHQLVDEARETRQGGKSIGTTRCGIGPAYEDKVARRGLRLSDLLDARTFAEKLRALFDYHAFLLKHYYQYSRLADVEVELEYLLSQRDVVLSMLCDVPARLAQLNKAEKHILYEGAQGSMLDIDHGTYPYVTSSNTLASNAGIGAGIPVAEIGQVIGVSKAYTTRVGAGPFPSELHGNHARHLAQQGKEFGATTGRARRCGWLDLVALKQAAYLNGVTSLCLTKLDVLSGLETLKVVVDYTGSDEATAANYDAEMVKLRQPIYATLETWEESISSVRSFAELPANAQNYVRFIEEYLSRSIDIVSVGPDRDSNIILRSL